MNNTKRNMKSAVMVVLLAMPCIANAGVIKSKSIKDDLTTAEPGAQYWKSAIVENVQLLAQPMIAPKPGKTTTANIQVQSVNNGKWVAFRFKWKDKEKSEAGRLGQFSDAVAVQFPVKSNDTPPPIFMGAKDNPVHIYHWRAQYQKDKEKGKPEMKDLYPNMSVDMYPMEMPDAGNVGKISKDKAEVYNPGIAAGNPQSYSKTGVDEIYAEGFSTSSVQDAHEASAKGEWNKGEWTVVITRPMVREGASTFEAGKKSFTAFAVWQGGELEAGSRKCVTMTWTPIEFEGGK